MKPKKITLDGLVYSTNKDLKLTEDIEDTITLLPVKQKLHLRYETKQRACKPVKIVAGFVGKTEELETLRKLLKTKCGIGGTVKDGEILLQGHVRERAKKILTDAGFGLK